MEMRAKEREPAPVLKALFDPESKMWILNSLRTFGYNRTFASLLAGGMSPSVAKAQLKDIIKKYGW